MMATIATINDMGSFAHNPRGNLWFNDDSSYGHKLLLKMGWSKGKGLGKQENGIKENLKVKFRNTNSGLGFKDDSYGNVMKTEYDSILRSLSAEYQQQNTVNRCTENLGLKNSKQKAKFVKCRIRYPKLYYGKDVSKYSEKDMKSIFICSLPTNEKEEEKSEDLRSLSKKENGNQVSNLYETHNSQLSISDYFNLKMKQKTDNKFIKQEISSEGERESRDFESSETGNKTIIKEENRELESTKQENAVLTISKKKKKKKIRNSELSTNNVVKSEFSIENDNKQNIMTLNNVGPLELKTSDSKDDFPDEEVWGLSNSSSNQLNASNRKRKRSHKNENLDTSEGSNSSLLKSEVCSDSLPPVPNKKRKKLNKNNEYKSVDSVELLSVSSKEEVLENGELVDISKSSSLQVKDTSPTNNYKSTKKSKNLKSKLRKLKNLKSCLKNKKDSYIVKNVSFNESISYRIIDSDKEYTDSLSHCQEISQNSSTPSDSNCGLDNDSDGDCVIISDNSFTEKNENNIVKNESESEESSEMEDCDSKSGLPSSSSSHYNYWVESQTQAMKMKMYKNLLKSIKKHDILKTSSLLSIKGYGNWGFKK